MTHIAHSFARLGLAAFGLLGTVACSDSSLSCGPGTVAKGGQCVVLVAPPSGCGAGTVQVGDQCLVPDAVDGPDGSGDDLAGTTDTNDSSDVAEVPDLIDAPDSSAAQCVPACDPGQLCQQGVCVTAAPPESWYCFASLYASGTTCDCGCGAPDPDCQIPAAPVSGCVGNAACTADGTCAACQPDCSGKQCGDDGCGGTCGVCLDPVLPACVAGKCMACIASCQGLACGDDGCGGSCGNCPNDQLCAFGQCVAPPPDQSCNDHCGGLAPSGCACTANCVAEGTCCIDVDLCGCIPACDGKQCGDDGCGGTCGECANAQLCTDGQCVFPACGPATCNGHGICDPVLVTCQCTGGYQGKYCDQCPPGQVGFPLCVVPCVDAAGCDDGEPCTADDCATGGGCVHLPVAATCTGGNACVQNACIEGTCQPASLTDCNDKNACTSDSCDPVAGCVYLPSGAIGCEDDKPCTSGDTCNGATCVAGNVPTSCDDGNVCTTDSCDALQGCLNAGTGAVCALGDPCSAGGVCKGTTCTSLGGKNCDDANACTIDSCAATNGDCQHATAPAGTVCDDDVACTQGDACGEAGTCIGGATACALTVKTGLLAHYAAWNLASLALSADKGVGSWQDLSGHGHDLSATDGSKLPVLADKAVLGGRGVRFAGSAGLASEALAVPSQVSLFLVVCVDAKTALGKVAEQGTGAASWSVGAGAQASALTWTIAGSSTALPVNSGQCYVVAGRSSAASRSLDVITTTATTAQDSGAELAVGTAPLTLGAVTLGATSGAIIGEILLYDRAVSDAERDGITAYLRTAWSFAPPAPDFAWYDASDLATVATATDGSGQVATWQDKSGLGRDVYAGSDLPPVWFASGTSNGRPAIRFDGAGVLMQSSAVATSAQMTVFAVFEMDKPQPWGTVFGQGATPLFALGKTETVASQAGWLVGATGAGPTLPLTPGQWQVWTAVQTATTATVSVDATNLQSVAQAGLAGPPLPLYLGNGGSSNRSMGGFVAEIRAYASALGAIDRAYVEALLRSKYGL